MSFKKEYLKKEKRYRRFKKKLYDAIAKEHRIVYDILPVSYLDLMLLSSDIPNNPKKSIAKISKWFNKKTTIFGVSANSNPEITTLQSCELYEFCERVAEEEGIGVDYTFEEHVQTIPFRADNSLKFTFCYISKFILYSLPEHTETFTETEQSIESFDF